MSTGWGVCARPLARARDEDGAVAILFAAAAMVLFLMAALVVDLGLARDVRRQSQNASDASALAAANVLYPTGSCTITQAKPCTLDAVAAAKAYAEANFPRVVGKWNTCAAPPSGFTAPDASIKCVAFDSTSAPTKVLVNLPTELVRTQLGVIANVKDVSVSSSARAAITAANKIKCGLCFLGNVDSGNADYTVSGGGSIAISGNVSLGAQGHMTAIGGGQVAVGGSYDESEGYSPTPVVDVDPFADPFAGETLPALSGTLRTNPCTAAPAGGPGVYGSFSLPNSTCTLQSGTYVITGTWDMKNNTKLQGTGVTLYVVCGTAATPRACGSSGEAGGYLDFKNGEVGITAPTGGFAIVYDRNNTNNLSLQGNGGTSITGKVYLKRAKLDFNGNSCFGFNGGPIVADGVVKANGNKSCVKVDNAPGIDSASVPGAVSLDR